jgi:hypothetical protein
VKEFSLTIPLEGLSQGLRSDYRSPRNSARLISCVNCKPTEFGLVPYDPIEIPFEEGLLDSYGIDFDWPYPQLWKGSGRTILTTGNRFFYVDESDWGLIELPIYNIDSEFPTNSETIDKSGAPWQFVDLSTHWYATNGRNVVMYANVAMGGKFSDVVRVERLFPAQAGAYYKGRIVLGGFGPYGVSQHVWEQFWTDIFETAGNKAGTGIVNKLNQLTQNFVLWSSIGGGDIPIFLFLPTYGEESFVNANRYGGTLPFRTLWFDMMQRNEWGFMPMPFRGKVLAMKVLRDILVVYGSDGIVAVRTVAAPVPTLGMLKIPGLEKVGLHSPGAVGGDESEHVFVDSAGHVWRLNADLEAVRLGYQEYTNPMLSGQIIVSLSTNEREYWIAGMEKTLHLTRTGLAETTQRVTSIIDVQGHRYGLGSYFDQSVSPATVVWDTIDLNNRGMKTIEQLQFPNDLGAAGRVYASVYWRNNSYETFRQTPWLIVNPSGVVRPKVTATDFRIALKFDNLVVAKIDYVTISYKQTDKRYIRGGYQVASTPSA